MEELITDAVTGLKLLVVFAVVCVIAVYIPKLLGDKKRKSKKKQPSRALMHFTVRSGKDIRIGGLFCIASGLIVLVIGLFYGDGPGSDLPYLLAVVIGFCALGALLLVYTIPGCWEIQVDGNVVRMVKVWVFIREWKISDISHAVQTRGGLKVYVKGQQRKAFFFDGMMECYTNFLRRMEKENIPVTTGHEAVQTFDGVFVQDDEALAAINGEEGDNDPIKGS